MRILVAQIGARRHYAIPAILERAGLLERFYTDLCANLGLLSLAGRMVPTRLRPQGLKRLLGRRVDGVPNAKIRCLPSFALRRVLRRTPAASPGDRLRGWVTANRQFCELVLRRGVDGADTLYGFNGAALELFQYAKSHEMQTILEQTSAPVEFEQRLLAEEREQWPDWENVGATANDWQPMADRERGEWDLADRIICGSEYVKHAIAEQGGPVERCRVVPYAAADHFFAATPRSHPRQPLRVLFVGTVCLGKGVPYLMQAAQQLRSEDVHCRVVGPVNVSDQAVGQLAESLELAGPVPRSEMAGQYQWADVLVLPSISEGSANVCYEALAAGLPVITTPHAGSVLRDGQEGFLVPIRCAESIADRIMRLAGDVSLYQQMSEQARTRAAEFTWERYADRLVNVLRS